MRKCQSNCKGLWPTKVDPSLAPSIPPRPRPRPLIPALTPALFLKKKKKVSPGKKRPSSVIH